MKRLNFNADWMFYKEGDDNHAVKVNLPHDAMLYEKRDPESKSSSAGAFFPGGRYIYTKKFFAPEEYKDKCITLEFEGIYRNSQVFINGRLAGGRPYGYSNFYIAMDDFLNYGSENEIKVIADNSKIPNSRWYTGSGIYRNGKLIVGSRTHIDLDGVRIVTRSFSPAVIQIESRFTDGDSLNPEVRTEIYFDGKLITKGSGDKREIEIKDPRLWSDDAPNLYQVRVTLVHDEKVIDEVTENFGIRLIEWDAKSGLRINGKVTKLRGACIHSDNGILGACSFAVAEERRIKMLKEAGFNAIRSAHNPISKAALEACDRYGMYLMDETFDTWFIHKTKFDYALDFGEWHSRDVEAMLHKDFNHPSVILYSIGNEVAETAQARGVQLAREMIELVHSLDHTRPVTCCVNLMLNGLASIGLGIYKEQDKPEKEPKKKKQGKPKKEKLSGSAFINALMNTIGKTMNNFGKMKFVDKATQQVFAALDIAGYNYGSGRYPLEARAYPDRVVLGAETFPADLAHNWQMVEKYPYLIGDFIWAGWDYLGEAGFGAIGYQSRGGASKDYPYLTSDCGVIDITGHLRPEVYFNKIVWGQWHTPYIGVEPLTFAGESHIDPMWRNSDARSSWSWAGCEGKTAQVRVYSDGDKVALLLNGKPLGVKKVNGYVANFKTPYQKGELLAIAYDKNGKETGRCSLISAGEKLQLAVKPEKTELKADGEDLAYLAIELTDDQGIVECGSDRRVSVKVEGAGILQGLGSANPYTEEAFDKDYHDTFFGQAQAVVRSGVEQGQVKVTVSADGLESQEVVLSVG